MLLLLFHLWLGSVLFLCIIPAFTLDIFVVVLFCFILIFLVLCVFEKARKVMQTERTKRPTKREYCICLYNRYRCVNICVWQREWSEKNKINKCTKENENVFIYEGGEYLYRCNVWFKDNNKQRRQHQHTHTHKANNVK